MATSCHSLNISMNRESVSSSFTKNSLRCISISSNELKLVDSMSLDSSFKYGGESRIYRSQSTGFPALGNVTNDLVVRSNRVPVTGHMKSHSMSYMEEFTSHLNQGDTVISIDGSSEFSTPGKKEANPPKKSHHQKYDVKIDTHKDSEFSDLDLSDNELQIHSDKQNGDSSAVELKNSRPPTRYKRVRHPSETSLILTCIWMFFFVLVALILCGPVIGLLCLFLPLGVAIKYGLDLCCCCKTKYSCLHTNRMSNSELFWLYDTNINKAIVQSLIIMESGLHITRLRDLINSRLISAINQYEEQVYPRLSQKVVALCCGYAWVPDPEFSLANHIHHMPSSIVTEEQLQDYVSQMANTQLSFERPLWEIQVLAEFGAKKDTVLLFRIHPCVSDGISLMKILHKSLLDCQSTMDLKPRFGNIAILFNALRALIIGPLVFFQWLFFQKKDSNPLTRTLSGKKRVAWSKPFNFSTANRLKQITRCTFGDLFFSVAAGSLRNYLFRRGVLKPPRIHVNIPVDLQSDESPTVMGNFYSLLSVPLPTATEGLIPRLWDVKLSMEEIKDSANPVIMYLSWWCLVYILPLRLCQKIWRTLLNKSTAMISILPGPTHEVTLASKKIKSMGYWMPATGDVGVSISFLTYGDEIRMTVVADEAVMPDPHVLTDDFVSMLDQLDATLAHRRLPGEFHSVVSLDNTNLDEPTIVEVQSRVTAVQTELQELKAEMEAKVGNEHHDQRRKMCHRVEELKAEFRELMAELRKRKHPNDLLSDEETELSQEERARKSYRSQTSTSRPLSTTDEMLKTDSSSVGSKNSLARSLNSRSSNNKTAVVHINLDQGLQRTREAELAEEDFSPCVEKKIPPMFVTI